MTTPNAMPGSSFKYRQKILGDLLHTLPTSWSRKTLGKDEAGKETVETTTINQHSLRYPLAANVSSENLDRLAERWLK